MPDHERRARSFCGLFERALEPGPHRALIAEVREAHIGPDGRVAHGGDDLFLVTSLERFEADKVLSQNSLRNGHRCWSSGDALSFKPAKAPLCVIATCLSWSAFDFEDLRAPVRTP